MLDVSNSAPEERAVEFRFMSAPEVPTEPSQIAVVPSDLSHRNHAAVPEAAIVTGEIAFAVITPFAAAPKAGLAGNVMVARRFCVVTAVSGVAGWVPS